jgi:hypothetical protein
MAKSLPTRSELDKGGSFFPSFSRAMNTELQSPLLKLQGKLDSCLAGRGVVLLNLQTEKHD